MTKADRAELSRIFLVYLTAPQAAQLIGDLERSKALAHLEGFREGLRSLRESLARDGLTVHVK